MSMSISNTRIATVVLVAFLAILTGCQSMPGPSRHNPNAEWSSPTTWDATTAKTAMGCITGAVAGAIFNHDNRLKGAGAGCAVGGVGGYIWGDAQDDEAERQAALLQQQGIRAQYNRQNKQLAIVLSNRQLQFAMGSAEVRNIAPVQKIAQAAMSTGMAVQVNGFASSEGDAGYNQRLSEARAGNVAQILVNAGVNASMIQVQGFGENPRYLIRNANGNEDRLASRRVEFKLVPAPQAQPAQQYQQPRQQAPQYRPAPAYRQQQGVNTSSVVKEAVNMFIRPW